LSFDPPLLFSEAFLQLTNRAEQAPSTSVHRIKRESVFFMMRNAVLGDCYKVKLP
jgi:hypothetical protein